MTGNWEPRSDDWSDAACVVAGQRDTACSDQAIDVVGLGDANDRRSYFGDGPRCRDIGSC